ncbi:rhodanese-related sulfurtransferase [Acholeplasma hippikon]|uniref:tRNA uridine(34) hydroxylase n=1 Tax=Acholeplasma hippikon TaxID=264636 RepID=A0A449BLB2_9MOLU|nr:rhodanese-related sulfurtransferase [Acholeplasma hippikon]VEU83229.1 putative rhodanese-related sulfurtransferase [Acholeplasma hippikon]
MENLEYRVLLFYKYVTIENPEKTVEEHLKFCKEIGVLGRILIAKEGINGTLSGTVEQTNKYIEYMKNHPLFNNIFFKIDAVDGHAFKKMHVRVKKELVNLSLEEDLNPLELTGKHLTAKEWYEAMQDPNTVIIDARNDYEYDLGHFRGAIKPEIRNFRELPQWVKQNKEKFEGKKILTYCTGGVRCEKFSGWLKREGFEDVGQLYGGIHTYGNDPEVQGQLWDGKMYVFDQRIAVDINKVEHVVVGKDYFTGEPCERYINCGNPDCNEQIICSEESEQKHMGSCCDACRLHPRNRWVIKHGLTIEDVKRRNLELAQTKEIN